MSPVATHEANLLDSIPGVLTWTDSSTLQRELADHHLGLLHSRFQEVLDQFVRAGVGARLQSLVGELPDESRARLMVAPETGRRLCWEPYTDLRFFVVSTLAEHRRLGASVVLAEPAWSALGDLRFPVTMENSSVDDGYYRAPQLTDGLTVDYLSPHAERALRSSQRPCVSYGASEIPGVVRKLESALAVVRRASAEAYELFSNSTRVVVVGRNVDDDSLLASFSSERTIGRLGLINVHAARVDVAAVADALVHEAIHSFLYVVEERCPILGDRDRASEVSVVSPWTGRTLSLHSFVHACYVWFGLWNFWSQAAVTKPVPPERATVLAERARRGFGVAAMRTALDITVDHLTRHGTSLLALIDEMRGGRFDD